mgnify:CR=1 FL=1
MNYKVFSLWLLLVTIWNYKYPNVQPWEDVFVAVVLSLMSKYLEKME